MKLLKSMVKLVWQFVSYLFWSQKTDKTRYDSNYCCPVKLKRA